MNVTIDSPEADKLAMGRWVNERYRKGFMVELDDGTQRPVTQFELYWGTEVKRVEACERRDRDGCCGELGIQGRCDGCGGFCPKWEAAHGQV